MLTQFDRRKCGIKPCFYDPEIITSLLLLLLEKTQECGRLFQLIKLNFISLGIRKLCTREEEWPSQCGGADASCAGAANGGLATVPF